MDKLSAKFKDSLPVHLKGNGEHERHHGKSQSHVAFENTSTSVAASQMRNALNNLADGIKEPKEKQRFETEMDNFFALFRRYLNDKAKGNEIEWSRIAPPKPEQVVDYNSLGNSESVEFLNKLAVLKLNGGLGTSMGCVGPKSVIEVRDGMSFLDLSVRQIEYLNRTYSVNVPFVLMNSFNTDSDTASIIKKYEGHNIDILTFNQSKYPRILKDSLLPAPKTAGSQISDWYPPGHGDVFESLYNSGILDKLLDRGVEIVFLSNADNLGAVVDLNILQHMVETRAEYIMELTDKTKADVKGGTIIDYEGQARLLEIAQVPKQYVNEFKSIKKFKYFNTNNIWMNLRAVKRVVENNELSMEIIPNGKSIPADKKGEADVSIIQLETAVGAEFLRKLQEGDETDESEAFDDMQNDKRFSETRDGSVSDHEEHELAEEKEKDDEEDLAGTARRPSLEQLKSAREAAVGRGSRYEGNPFDLDRVNTHESFGSRKTRSRATSRASSRARR